MNIPYVALASPPVMAENQESVGWGFLIPAAKCRTKAEQAASWQKKLYFSWYYGQIRHAAGLLLLPPRDGNDPHGVI